MSTERMTVDAMIEMHTHVPPVVLSETLPALEEMGPLSPDRDQHPEPGDLYVLGNDGFLRRLDTLGADAPRLYALTVAGGSPHRFAAYINTTLPEFVPDVISIQFGAHSNVVILRARPSMVEKARAEGRW